MATIRMDIGELSGRLPTLADWTRPGDVVVVTQDGRPICQLLPVTDDVATPTHVGAPPPAAAPQAHRPVGARPGAVWIPDNFNDPAAWADSITDRQVGP